MEWVERTDRTVEAAKDFLLDQLGVDESEAEFEILEEPKPGLFGRVRGQARVRARVAPRAPRPKEERRRRNKNRHEGKDRTSQPKAGRQPSNSQPAGGSGASSKAGSPKSKNVGGGNGGRNNEPETTTSALEVVDPARFVEPLSTFLKELVAAFELPADVVVEVASDGALEASINGTQLGALIGPAGGVIEAIRELSRTFLQKEANGESAPRVRVDVGGYRHGRRDALSAFAVELANEVRATGSTYVLEVMGSADRKVVHDAIAELDGVVSRSEGEDPDRRVAIAPAD
jgi:spoIIIJ-associated protein